MSQIKDKLLRHQILVQRFAASQYESMQVFIDVAIDRTLSRVGSGRYLSPAEGQALEKELLNLFERMTINTMENLDDFAFYEASFVARTIGGEIPTGDKLKRGIRLKRMGIGLDTGKSAKSLPTSLKEFNRRKAREIVKKARQISIQDSDRVNAERQLLQLKRLISAQAKTLSATIVNHTATVAKDATYQTNRNLIDFVRWCSVLDQATTDFCREHNGAVYAVDEGPRPPAHFNCRSFMEVVLK